MKLVTATQMRQIDRHAIETIGMPSLTLMESAGEGVARYLQHSYTDQMLGHIAVYCGTGNNGGDGLVVARMLHQHGRSVTAILCGDTAKLTSDTKVNFDRALSAGVHVVQWSQQRQSTQLSEVPSLIVDALLGTGSSGSPRGAIADAIDQINRYVTNVVSIDIPSGVSADAGEVETIAVQASSTCTLGLPKLGLYVSPGREHVGRVEVVPIGLPKESVDGSSSIAMMLTHTEARMLLPVRKPDGHKGDFGKLLIIVGSTGLAGAAALAARAALRTGCGLVRVALPSSILPTVASLVPEATTFPLPDVAKRGALALRALGAILELVQEYDAVALGSGLGRHHETMELVRRLVRRIDKPIVIDADGIVALAGERALLRDRNHPTILTPHPGEYERLVGEPALPDYLNRIEQVRQFASQMGVHLLLKGSPTIGADPEGSVWLNPTGNDGMATGGSGDVLTGIIGSLLVQGCEPAVGTRLGAYVHGLAGDAAARKLTRRGMIASDIVECIPRALAELEKGP